jgi:tetratricopeptide (TPR) repeat protein
VQLDEKKNYFCKAKKSEMTDNLENANELVEKIKGNKNFKATAIAVGAVVILILGYVGYDSAIAQPANEKSKTSYWKELILLENDSLDLALEGFEVIAKKHDGKIGGEVSNFVTGRLYMEKGEFATAIKFLEKTDVNDVYVSSMAIGLQGDCYVELNDFAKAVKLYEKAANLKSNEMTSPVYLKKAGLVYELELKNFAKATELYTRIETEFNDFAKSNNIEKYIARASNKE